MLYVWIVMGAGAGGVVRYWLSNLNRHWLYGHVPLGTLLANIAGSALLAIGLAQSGFSLFHPNSSTLPASLTAALLIGTSGGLTTFSTLVAETLEPRRCGTRRTLANRTWLWGVHIALCAGAATIAYALT